MEERTVEDAFGVPIRVGDLVASIRAGKGSQVKVKGRVDKIGSGETEVRVRVLTETGPEWISCYRAIRTIQSNDHFYVVSHTNTKELWQGSHEDEVVFDSIASARNYIERWYGSSPNIFGTPLEWQNETTAKAGFYTVEILSKELVIE